MTVTRAQTHKEEKERLLQELEELRTKSSRLELDLVGMRKLLRDSEAKRKFVSLLRSAKGVGLCASHRSAPLSE
jgi:hypothetical protein